MLNQKLSVPSIDDLISILEWMRIGKGYVIESPGVYSGAFIQLPAGVSGQCSIPVSFIRYPIVWAGDVTL